MKFNCPVCGSHFFGSSVNEDGSLQRNCHGYIKRERCRFTFNEKDDSKYFVEIFNSPQQTVEKIANQIKKVKSYKTDCAFSKEDVVNMLEQLLKP